MRSELSEKKGNPSAISGKGGVREAAERRLHAE